MVHSSLIIQTELSQWLTPPRNDNFPYVGPVISRSSCPRTGTFVRAKTRTTNGGQKMAWRARTPTGTNYGSATDTNVFLMFAWPPPNGRNWDKCWTLIFTAVARYIFLQLCRPTINVIIMKFITISTQLMPSRICDSFLCLSWVWVSRRALNVRWRWTRTSLTFLFFVSYIT